MSIFAPMNPINLWPQGQVGGYCFLLPPLPCGAMNNVQYENLCYRFFHHSSQSLAIRADLLM